MSSDSPADESFKICMLTLNCWGVPLLGCSDRSLRMHAIADYLAAHPHVDVVCLQEIWRIEDFQLIKQRCSALFLHIHRFTSGLVGSGIVILSKFRFVDLLTYRFSVNGYAHHVHRGDWYGGKIVGLARLYVPQMDSLISVYGTHLHAEYDRINDTYLAHRVVQSLELCQFIRLTTRPHEFAFLMGDLNLEPTNLGYRIITQVAGLEDAWLSDVLPGEKVEVGGQNENSEPQGQLNGEKEVSVEDRRSDDFLQLFWVLLDDLQILGLVTLVPQNFSEDCESGFTCDRSDNSYSTVQNRPKRIDYVMFKKVKGHSVQVVDKCVTMHRIPQNPQRNYTDHSAVRIKFAIKKDPPADHRPTSAELFVARRCLTDASVVVADGVRNSRANRLHFVVCGAVAFALFLALLYLSAFYPERVRVGIVMLVSFGLALFFGFYVWHGAVVLGTEENALLEAKEELEVWFQSLLRT